MLVIYIIDVDSIEDINKS